MVEEGAEKFCSVGTARSRSFRPSDLSLGQRPQNRVDAKVIKLEILVSRSFPITDIRFVPYFPQPGLYLGIAVAPAQMVDELENEFGPLLVILWRVGPSGVNFTDRSPRKVVTVRFRVGGKRLRHETDFNQGSDPGCAKRVENLVQNIPTINRVSRCIFRIDIGRSPF